MSFLQILDKAASVYQFPIFENNNVFLGGSKLTLFRNKIDWALIIEIVACDNNFSGHNGIVNSVFTYYKNNEFEDYELLYYNPTCDSEICNTFCSDDANILNLGCSFFMLNGIQIEVPKDRIQYFSNNIIWYVYSLRYLSSSNTVLFCHL